MELRTCNYYNMEVAMDFQLSKMHLLQQELFRKFAETEIRPLAKEMDEKEEYDLDLLAKMQRYGFFSIPYSRQYGGAGADPLHCICICLAAGACDREFYVLSDSCNKISER